VKTKLPRELKKIIRGKISKSKRQPNLSLLKVMMKALKNQQMKLMMEKLMQMMNYKLFSRK